MIKKCFAGQTRQPRRENRLQRPEIKIAWQNTTANGRQLHIQSWLQQWRSDQFGNGHRQQLPSFGAQLTGI